MADIFRRLKAMANWKRIVEDHSKKAYKWPSGWDSRETIADQLECSPERVAEILSRAIKDGEVEKKPITYWDENLKKKVTAIGYKQIEKKEKSEKKISATINWPPAEGIRVSRLDNPKSRGTHIGKGKIQWDNGHTTQPKGSTIKKIILAI